MDDSKRPVAKRQISRLLGSSTSPMYVLSEDSTLVFANDALAAHVGLPAESLLGLQCSTPLVADEATNSKLLAWLALPIQWPKQQFRFMEVSDFSSVEASTSKKWLRFMVPLDEADNGCILCVLCDYPTAASFVSEQAIAPPHLPSFIDAVSSNIHRVLNATRSRFSRLDGLWFLHGSSPLSERALEQIQVAITNHYPLTIFGPTGSGRSWIAQAIHSHRNLGSDRHRIANSLVRIDCNLMDSDLLKSMLELVDENGRDGEPCVLLDSLDSLPVDCYALLINYLKRRSRVSFIATCSRSFAPSNRSANQLWSDIVLRTATVRIDVPSILERLEDMRNLVVAWMDANRAQDARPVDFANRFIDALTAHAWPNDVEEFSSTMQYALNALLKTNQGDGPRILDEQHLPVNIRTCVSHAEQTLVDDTIDLDAILEDVEKTMILRALGRFPNNKTSAAKLLSISRARLIRRLQQWGIQAESEPMDGDDDIPIFNEVP